MILPTTYLAALLLSIASMICWGSWANTQKLAGKWRFELFYYDYSLGMLLCAVIAAYTFGSFNAHELTFSDNLLIVSKRQMAYAAAAGAVFNLANMLLVAAIAVSGMAVAFPVAIGLALVIGVVWNYILNPQGDPILLFGGALLVLVAIVVDAFAYATFLDAKHAAELKALTPDPRTSKSAARKHQRGPGRGILLSVVGGILMGTFYPLIETARSGDDAVSPYGIGVLFGIGVIVTSIVYVPFFLNFPVDGKPINASQYFNGTIRQHFLGWLGGIVWMVGGICNFLSASAPSKLQVGPAVSYALGQGATMISALWGVFVWREFKGASERVKLLLLVMFVLFLSGLTMISMAPLRAK
jgi:glucose uptake protein